MLNKLTKPIPHTSKKIPDVFVVFFFITVFPDVQSGAVSTGDHLLEIESLAGYTCHTTVSSSSSCMWHYEQHACFRMVLPAYLNLALLALPPLYLLSRLLLDNTFVWFKNNYIIEFPPSVCNEKPSTTALGNKR